MAMPTFLVVGAAKSGTSSLDRYLSLHPEVYMAPRKEAHFFSIPDFPPQFTGPGDDGMNRFTVRTWDAYLELFRDAEDDTRKKAIGESSVFHLYYPGTAERIGRLLPDVRIIIMLRNPVDRAYSAYMHLIRDGREQLDFASSLKLEEERKAKHFEPMWYYRELGLYTEQVGRYLQVFGPDRVKVVIFEDFIRDTVGTLRDIFAFLGVDDRVLVDTSVAVNESGVPKSRGAYDFVANKHILKELIKPLFPAKARERIGLTVKSLLLRKESMDVHTRLELTEYFSEDINRLERLLDRDLTIWRPPSSVTEAG